MATSKGKRLSPRPRRAGRGTRKGSARLIDRVESSGRSIPGKKRLPVRSEVAEDLPEGAFDPADLDEPGKDNFDCDS